MIRVAFHFLHVSIVDLRDRMGIACKCILDPYIRNIGHPVAGILHPGRNLCATILPTVEFLVQCRADDDRIRQRHRVPC